MKCLDLTTLNYLTTVNVIPEKAEASVMIRTARDSPKVLEIVKQIAAESEPAGRLTVEGVHTIDAQVLDANIPGFENIAVSYTTDVPYLKGSFKRYLYGSGSIHVAHSDHEHVAVDELYDSVDGYKKLVTYSLKQ